MAAKKADIAATVTGNGLLGTLWFCSCPCIEKKKIRKAEKQERRGMDAPFGNRRRASPV